MKRGGLAIVLAIILAILERECRKALDGGKKIAALVATLGTTDGQPRFPSPAGTRVHPQSTAPITVPRNSNQESEQL